MFFTTKLIAKTLHIYLGMPQNAFDGQALLSEP